MINVYEAVGGVRICKGTGGTDTEEEEERKEIIPRTFHRPFPLSDIRKLILQSFR
jgi:hypothetical protein